MSAETQPFAHSPESWRDAPWMPFALHEMGVREIVGAQDNPRILEYLATCHPPAALMHDETAWCSAFANWCMQQAGLERTHKLNARSWDTWGVETVAPFPGCVCVFWRATPDDTAHRFHGHVGFWMGAHGSDVLVLGGNENNCVSVKPYPAARLIAYRALA